MSQPSDSLPPPSRKGSSSTRLSGQEALSGGAVPPKLPPGATAGDGGAPKEMAWMPKPAKQRKRSIKGRLFAVGGCLALSLSLVLTFKMAFRPPEYENCWPTAERFISLLKQGENPAEDDPDERIGYALAHEMFSESLQDDCPFTEFFQTFARLSRDHGEIMASESLEQRRVKGDSRRRNFRYLLYFGHPHQSTQEMSPFTVHLRFVQRGNEYLLNDWRIEPARSER